MATKDATTIAEEQRQAGREWLAVFVAGGGKLSWRFERIDPILLAEIHQLLGAAFESGSEDGKQTFYSE